MNWILFYLYYTYYAYYVYYHLFMRNDSLELATRCHLAGQAARLFLDTRRRPDTFGSINYYTYYIYYIKYIHYLFHMRKIDKRNIISHKSVVFCIVILASG